MTDGVLIQQASGEWTPMLELTVGRHGDYCARHGLTYWPVLGRVQFRRSAHWDKLVLIRHALELGFPTVAWLDSDTLIVRDEADWRGALDPSGGPLGCVWHPAHAETGAPEHWNTGVMFIRNTPRVREFFARVWEQGPLGDHTWHEQARIMALLPEFPGLVQRLDDRWNSLPLINESPDPVIKAWHGHGTWAINPMHDELKHLGAVDARVQAAEEHFIHEGNCAARAAEFIANIPPYPGGYAGRGLVICGGGEGYFPCLWVAVRQLRRVGCRLPVQVWHLGPREMDDAMRALLTPSGVTCVDAHEVARRHPAMNLRGWEVKSFALHHSPFREVLLLDADNVAVRDPEFLFDTPPFREHGAIFWRDYWRTKPEQTSWRVFDVPFRAEWEFESGQIVLDKARVWPQLLLTRWYNDHSHFFYRHVWGDKDTFRFAWHRTGTPFAMPPFEIEALEDTMCQHDFEGRRIFQHRNTDKWSLRSENKRVAGFQFEAECLEDLALLKQVWSGRVARPSA
jgi:hypothetical protein